MPTLDAAQAARRPLLTEPLSPEKRPWWRSLVLLLVLLLALVLYIVLINVAPPIDAVLILPFLHVWMLCFVPYLAACGFVLLTKPASGPWRWIELGIILVGALLFRIMLVPLPPNLSHDSWRYLWDARVTLHGYSPYVYPPWDKAFLSLRDFIYDNSRFRDVPTIYPPGAQAVYLLSYLLAPATCFSSKEYSSFLIWLPVAHWHCSCSKEDWTHAVSLFTPGLHCPSSNLLCRVTSMPLP
ncbi:MAG: hypothetical protein M3Y76_05355 [Chloroflexota bacterium]|nr:hypothetical protein [Chloroflexota bacterium]